MYYNKWELDLRRDPVSLKLDTSDKVNRVSSKTYKPVAFGSIVEVLFPRVDDKTNEKYKKILIDFVIQKMRDEINDCNAVIEKWRR